MNQINCYTCISLHGRDIILCIKIKDGIDATFNTVVNGKKQ